MTARVKIADFGVIQKSLAYATVTFYVMNDDGGNSGVKATIFQANTGTGARENPQTLDENGQLSADCYVESAVMATISGINDRTERLIKKIQQNPLEFQLPITSSVFLKEATEEAIAAANIDDVIDNIDDIIAVGNNIAAVNTASTNIAAIIAAPTAATNAASSATTATTQAGIATTQASNASTSAGTATTQAGIATTQAGIATTQAGIATTQAAIATGATDKWNYSTTTTMADPSSGNFRLNNATIASATAMAISATNTAAANLRTWIASWDDSSNPIRGTVTLRKVGTPATFATFNVTGALTDNTTWLELALTYVTGNGAFSNLDQFVIEFDRAGNAGAAGIGSYDGGTAGGTANALTCTASPTMSAYSDLNNKLLIVKASASANTTSATINISSLGVVTLKKFDSTYAKVNLAANDIPASGILELTRDGTDIILMNPSPTVAASGLYKGSSASGGGNAFTTTATPAMTAYSDLNNGLIIFTSESSVQTGSATVNISGLGAVTVKKIGLAGAKVNLVGGDIAPLTQIILTQDGTDVILLNPRTSSNGWLSDLENFWYQYDDFIGKATGNYTNTVSGAGAAFTLSGNTGYITAATGTTTTGRCVINGTSNPASNNANTKLLGSELEFAATVSALSNGTDRYSLYLGKHDGTGAAEPANGIYFRYTDTVNSGRWQCVCRSGGVESIINAASATPTQNVYLGQQLKWVGLSSSSVEFFIDGVSQGIISSNVPTLGASSPIWDFAIAKSLGTTSQSVNITAVKTIRAKT